MQKLGNIDAPYGYVKGTDEKKLPIIDEPAASNVRRIFEMRASGISPKHIARNLMMRIFQFHQIIGLKNLVLRHIDLVIIFGHVML